MVAQISGKGIMHVQEHTRACLVIITLGELENKGSFGVGVFRDMFEVLRGILSFYGLDKEFFSREDQDESWLDSRGIKFGGMLIVGSVFQLELEAVVLSAWGCFAVFFKGFWWGVGCIGGDAGKGDEEGG